ncbi:hypothetical protein McpSp1_08520 [Methanocorpusculaceae archaeon Sp1]|nr:hypothetical protein [Methanocorpusculaceae archaeon Sp1]
MKSKHILLILLIGILAVSLIAAPAAARDVTPGSTIFVYEDGLAFTGGLSTITQLQYTQNNNVLNTIPVQDPKNFNLLAASVGGYTGSWNAVDASGTHLGTVMIYYPELSIDIVLAKDGYSSVQEYGFVDTEYYKVKINAPQVGPSGVGATANVVFKGIDGAETTYASGSNFANIPIDSAQVLTTQAFRPEDLRQTTTIYAEWNTPASFHNYAPKSNSITMNYDDVGNSGTHITFNPTVTKTIAPVTTVRTTIPTTVRTTVPTTEIPTPIPTTETPTPAPTQSPLPLVLAPLAVLAGALLLRK